MKTEFVSIQVPIADFYEDNRIKQQDIDESLLKKWAKDAIKDIITDEQWVHRLAWLSVDNYKAILPDDFELVCEISYKESEKDTSCDVRGYQITQFVQQTHEGCELELNVTCPSCHHTNCDCHTQDVVVDINTAWRVSHPEIYYDKYRYVGRFGYGKSIYSQDWQILSHTNNPYFGLNRHLPDCANIHCVHCPNTYRLELPHIETSFERGDILLSYMGKKIDENGDIMIPKHRDVFETILQHLTYKYYRAEYLEKRDPSDDKISKEAMFLRDQASTKAIIRLGTPSFDEFSKFWAENKWSKIDAAYDDMLTGRNLYNNKYYYDANVGVAYLNERNIYKS